MKRTKRLIIASNRLPVTCVVDPETKGWHITQSSGGLVAALSGIRKEDYNAFIWVGWPGMDRPEDDEQCAALEALLWRDFHAVPVWIRADSMDLHYNGFCNDILWPLFHYLHTFTYQPSAYAAYQHVNQRFAQEIARYYQPGDLVWVHDFHLMLLPQLIRHQFPNSLIGFFLHIPFPSSDLYKLLPVRRALLLGILSANLIGFHTCSYIRHFTICCTLILPEFPQHPTLITTPSHPCTIGKFPVGIQPEVFWHRLQQKEVQDRIQALQVRYAGYKVIIGVDRLDYIKGIPLKIRAMRKLFAHYPQWRKKVILIQVAVPSRETVVAYKALKSEVDQLVSKCNVQYGDVTYQPIRYLYHSVTAVELTALYHISDMCFITSTRDGMNLVAQEYVACQDHKHGVLVLSEFCGAIHSLSGALRINPWDLQQVIQQLDRALSMPSQERMTRHQVNADIVKTFTAAHWADTFTTQLRASSP